MEENKEFRQDLHEELWMWLSRFPLREKMDWPRWSYNGGDVPECPTDCFACESCPRDTSRDFRDCTRCPLVWNGDLKDLCLHAEYDRWCHEDNLEKRSRLAMKIAKLPLRSNVERDLRNLKLFTFSVMVLFIISCIEVLLH